MCDGSSCHVFKTGYCIKCPLDVFRDMREKEATQQDINKFHFCCIMGGTKYEMDNGDKVDCDDAFRTTGGNPPGAFNATNHAFAALKPEYECDAESKVAADAMIKVS